MNKLTSRRLFALQSGAALFSACINRAFGKPLFHTGEFISGQTRNKPQPAILSDESLARLAEVMKTDSVPGLSAAIIKDGKVV